MATKEMTMEETSIFRLELLADFLEKLPKRRFDYENYVGELWEGKADLSCGTSACALGWATTLPELRAAGLRLVKENGFGTVTLQLSKEGTGFGPLGAAMSVFKISKQDAMWLFYPSDYHCEFRQDSPGPGSGSKAVANHIRRFLKLRFDHARPRR